MNTPLKISLFILAVGYSLPGNQLFSQWLTQSFPSSEYLWKVRFADVNTGWILGQQFIYKTTNSGSSWTLQDTSMGAGFALYALDDKTVFYTNFTGVPPYSRGIRRTTNGGVSWATVDTTAFYCTHIEFHDPMVGFAVGGTPVSYHPIVRKTTDGGSTWETAWTGTGDFEFTGFSFIDATHAWAVSYDAYLYYTSDGGANWTLRDSIRHMQSGYPAPYPVRDIRFVTPDDAWAVGGIAGIMLIARTSNGGATWSDTIMGGGSAREVQFIDSQEGWIIAMNDDPLHTTDGGASWQRQTSTPRFTTWESMSIVNPNRGWAVGADGNVYSIANPVSVSDTRAGIPVETRLDQNYPNPFNPSTAISYKLSAVGFVKLRVFDVLGREVATLVNEVKQPGVYTVRFDARLPGLRAGQAGGQGSGLPSGAYFYRLQAGSFVETRKLLILR